MSGDGDKLISENYVNALEQWNVALLARVEQAEKERDAFAVGLMNVHATLAGSVDCGYSADHLPTMRTAMEMARAKLASTEPTREET